MARSLKEGYQARKLRALKEHAIELDRQMLHETRVANTLLEAMDQSDLDKVSKIIEKLERIKNAVVDLKSLKKGIEAAQNELNKYTAGGPITKAWTKLKGKVGIDNPVVKITTFANALEQGFGQLPQILKNSGIDPAKLKDQADTMTLSDAITQQFVKQRDPTADALKKTIPNKKPADMNLEADGDITADDVEANAAAAGSKEAQKKLKILVSSLQKALTPGGVFGAFKKVPYVDTSTLVKELATVAKVNELLSIFRAIKEGPQTGEIAADIKQNIAGGSGDVGSASTSPTGSSKPTGQSTPSSPAEPAVPGGSPSTPTGAKTPDAPGEKGGGGAEPEDDKVKQKKASDLGSQLASIFKGNSVEPEVLGKILMDSGLNVDELMKNIASHKAQKDAGKKPKPAAV